MTSGAQAASLRPLTWMATTGSRHGVEKSENSLWRFLGNAISRCTCLEIGLKIHSWKIASRPSSLCSSEIWQTLQI